MGSTPAEIEEARKAASEDLSRQERIRSEAPEHRVILTQAIYLAVLEVTQGDYLSTMGKNPSFHARTGPVAKFARKVANLDTMNHAVEGVSWNDAAEFCEILSQREDLISFYSHADEKATRREGTGYRLPTEAEWEFACRAGTTTKYWCGEWDKDLGAVGWCGADSGGRTHNTAKLKSNPFGLFDVHGNVSEWVEDWWEPTYYGQFGDKPAIDPQGPSSARSERVIRGGNWNHGPSACRSAHRDAAGPTNRNNEVGFRVVLTVDAVKKRLDRNPASAAVASAEKRSSSARTPRPAVAPFGAPQASAFQLAWARYLGLPSAYANSLGMKFVLIPPGEFTMGGTPAEIEDAIRATDTGDEGGEEWVRSIKSEAPRHKVILTRPFYLGAYEVRQKDFEAVMGKNPSYYARTGPNPEYVAKVVGIDTSSFPVGGVKWNDAAAFCAMLSERENLNPLYSVAGETVQRMEGNGYRLPTEAEWEFACRAGTTTRYWSGETAQDLVGVGWSAPTSGGRAHEVGELRSNPFGLFDVHGNAFEWVEDWWEPTYYRQFAEKPAINPCCPFSSSSQHVVRGGNDRNFPINCRSSTRHAVGSWEKTYMFMYGVRVLLTVDAVKQAIALRGRSRSGRPSSPAVEKGR